MLPLQGPESEAYLTRARVIDMKPLPVGVSNPKQAALTDGTTTARAVWKTIDVYRPVQYFRDGGPPEIGFSDSYKHEIAAYELDKLLGLGLVPVTVERRIHGEKGSLQLWIEETITEADRLERELQPPDLEQWNRQMFNVRLFHQLSYNTDFNNVRNLLVDKEFRIYAIDHSRAFRVGEELLAEADLKRFSRSALARLRELDEPILKEKLGRWLTRKARKALLERRDRIVERADRLVAERGEEAVLYP